MKKPDFSQIGEVIKEIRESLGLQQSDLSRGICSQSQLSKIENGSALPKATTLYMLSKRLGIDVNTLFELSTSSRLDYVFEFEVQLRELTRKKDYNAVLELVRSEKNNPIFRKNTYNKQLLLWHEAISIFHTQKQSGLAMELLTEALSLTSSTDQFYNEREIEILNSIGILHFETRQYDKAVEIYEKAISFFNSYPGQLYSTKVMVRVYYNLAKALTRLNKYIDSNNICLQGIKHCLKKESLYLLGELYYHKGYNFYLMRDRAACLKDFKKAVSIFELTGNTGYIEYINNLIEEGAE